MFASYNDCVSFPSYTTTVHNQIGNYNKVQGYTSEHPYPDSSRPQIRLKVQQDNDWTHSQDNTGNDLEKVWMSLDGPARAPNKHLSRPL